MVSQHSATSAHHAGWPPPHPRAESTVRAYRSDLRDVSEFVAARGSVGSLDELDGRHVFAYLIHLVRAGRAPSTVRRRLTSLRAYVAEHSNTQLSVDDLHRIEDRIMASVDTPTSVLVVSDDAIVREGLAVLLAREGVLTWTDRTDQPVIGGGDVWDYVLVWLPSRRGIDPFGSVEWVAEASGNGVPVVALYPNRITDLVRLRLSEAGARYAIPQGWLAGRAEGLYQLLADAELPDRFHLETPLALRQRLGLRLSGQLAPLLAAAAELDPAIWRELVRDDAPRLTRRQVQRLRHVASDVAGIPPPSGRYSTAIRNAPVTPDWREVRRVVRHSFNLR